MNQSWRCLCNFSAHRWDDGAVIYDRASGDTHHLSLPTLFVLQSLQQSPASPMQLAQQLHADATPTAEDVGTIEAILDNLHDLGLIESTVQ